MSAIAVLIGLLVLAYIGTILVGGRAIRGYGLPSGAEYLMLGFVLGPHVLAVLDRSTLSVFDPMVQVGLGWLALVVGLDYAVMGERRVGWRATLTSVAFTLCCGGCVALAVWHVSAHVGPFDASDRMLLAGGMGAAMCETTRYAVRWVVERYGAVGPVSELVAAIADADDVVPLVLLAWLFASNPVAGQTLAWPTSIWFLLTVGLGVVLGLGCTALLGDQLDAGEAMTFVLGAALLGIGVATELGLSWMTTMFVFGLTVSLASKHRADLRSMLALTEQPVLLPLFVLAGARLQIEFSWWVLALLVAALAARTAAKVGCGFLLSVADVSARRAGRGLGLGFLSCGALTISVGFAFALRFPERVGPLVLTAAVAATLFGELLGPTALRRALYRAGELTKALASRTLLGLRTN